MYIPVQLSAWAQKSPSSYHSVLAITEQANSPDDPAMHKTLVRFHHALTFVPTKLWLLHSPFCLCCPADWIVSNTVTFRSSIALPSWKGGVKTTSTHIVQMNKGLMIFAINIWRNILKILSFIGSSFSKVKHFSSYPATIISVYYTAISHKQAY